MTDQLPRMLAQLGGPVEAVPELPSPPAIQRYLLESPLPVLLLLIVAAALVFFWFNRNGKAREGLLASTGVALLAAGIALTARLVTTEREALRQRTETLIDAVARADTTALAPMLASDVQLTVYGSSSRSPFDRDEVLSLVEKYPGSLYKVRRHQIVERQAVMDASNTGRTQVRVRTEGESFPSIGSWWKVHWRQDGAGSEGWKVTAIECVRIDFVSDPGSLAP